MGGRAENVNITNFTLYADDKPINIAGIQSLTLDPLPDAETSYVKDFNSEITLTCTLKHKNMYRMSRKRCIKLLMGRGINRNKANKIAHIVQECGVPYKSKWFEIMFLY